MRERGEPAPAGMNRRPTIECERLHRDTRLDSDYGAKLPLASTGYDQESNE
jgi:hypothetical protein